ncbi:hypothetical protein B0H19DRAFT_1365572 [Mycena capillaripes]|nr:hypothetical protein B0H19DRAFT_1365572 [Mycena capillaripes]
MSSPPAKRQRTEDASITRSDIWYDDGSIVLQAQNTQFRVHWSILSQHSSFFREIRGLPQPPSNQPSVDGCPVVELQDDVTDVEHLLKILYDLKLLFQPALPLPVIAALIRLGRKYDFRDVLNSAVERVTFENPAIFEEFCTLFVDGVYTTTRIVPYAGIFFDILTLARENNIASALPVAYYRAATCSLDMLLDGIHRKDGTVASLATVDLHQCIRGREKLINAQSQPGFTWGWLKHGVWAHDEDCTNTSGRCTSIREALLIKCTEVVQLRALGQFAPERPRGLCIGCRQHANDLVSAGRKKIWDELPCFFGLLPWDELKNDL